MNYDGFRGSGDMAQLSYGITELRGITGITGITVGITNYGDTWNYGDTCEVHPSTETR